MVYVASFAKRSPLINRIINTLTIGIICIGIVVSLTNKVCIDAHDQFGRKTYYPTLEFFVICVLVVFAPRVLMGHIFVVYMSKILCFICHTKMKVMIHMVKMHKNCALKNVGHWHVFGNVAAASLYYGVNLARKMFVGKY